jgi:hypothetical protein
MFPEDVAVDGSRDVFIAGTSGKISHSAPLSGLKWALQK